VRAISLSRSSLLRRVRYCLPAALAIAFLSSGCGSRGDAVKVAHIYDPLSGPSMKANVDWLSEVIEAYVQEHPATKISLEQIKWDEIDAKLLTDYRAGAAHDLVWTSPQWMPKHFYTGDLLDLAPLLNWDANEVADFSWNPVWSKCREGETQIGIPTGAHTRLVCFRRDMFADAGLDPDNPPETLEALVDAALKLTRDADGDGEPDVWGLGVYCGRSRGTIELAFAPILWHLGGELWDPSTRKATFASPAGVQTAQFLYDLIHKHKVCPAWCATGTYDDAILKPFLAGKLAMGWGWGSYWIEVLEQEGWIQGLFPPTRDGKPVKADVFITPTGPQAQFTNAWTLSVHALSKRPEQAADLLDFIARPERLAAFPDAGLPARRATWERPEYETRFWQTWRLAAEKGRPMPATRYYNELADGVAAAIQRIILEGAPIEETLKQAEDEYNARLAGT